MQRNKITSGILIASLFSTISFASQAPLHSLTPTSNDVSYNPIPSYQASKAFDSAASSAKLSSFSLGMPDDTVQAGDRRRTGRRK